jgi:hypothetical protein
VDFVMLHPEAGAARSGNDASCVLRVSNAAGAVLLTGDIEAEAEDRLVTAHRPQLTASVVVAPHHGSRTSSTTALIAATTPDYVVYAAGFRNRYGFPASEVVARWGAAGATGINTADSGAVSFEFRHDGRRLGPTRYRDTERRYWHYRANGTNGGTNGVRLDLEPMGSDSIDARRQPRNPPRRSALDPRPLPLSWVPPQMRYHGAAPQGLNSPKPASTAGGSMEVQSRCSSSSKPAVGSWCRSLPVPLPRWPSSSNACGPTAKARCCPETWSARSGSCTARTA